MKIQQIILLIIAHNNSFASSFLQQVAYSNTAIRSHCYDRTRSLVDLTVPHYSQSSSSTTRLYGFFDQFGNKNENNKDDNDDEEGEEKKELEISSTDLETARKAFEEMFTILPNDNHKKKKKKNDANNNTQNPSLYGMMNNIDESSSISTNKDKEQRDTITKTRDITKIANSVPQTPLTAITRERRLKEITLLSTLTQSDDAVNELWALWIAERGPAATTSLLRAEQLMSVESYDEAESLLWSLIHQYGIHWAEPVNRLATLKYMQGSLDESKRLCEMTLQVKPWHFGALSGIVLVCTAMNDATGARLWAERRLPPLVPEYTSGNRRMAWIDRALDEAKESLNIASKVGRAGIGEIETEFRAFRAQMQHLIIEDDSSPSSLASDDLDAWQ